MRWAPQPRGQSNSSHSQPRARARGCCRAPQSRQVPSSTPDPGVCELHRETRRQGARGSSGRVAAGCGALPKAGRRHLNVGFRLTLFRRAQGAGASPQQGWPGAVQELLRSLPAAGGS